MSGAGAAADAASVVLGESLYSLVYTSEALHEVGEDLLSALLAQSRAANAAKGITGILLYRRARFVQFLEGPERQVRALMGLISADPRHTNVRILMDGHPSERQFGEWTMGYQLMKGNDASPPEGFRDSFDDVEALDDSDAVLRAVRELTLWFRVRALDARPSPE